MRLFRNRRERGQRGTVLLLVILITGLLATVTSSYSGSIVDRMEVHRDEASALHADFAAEAGLEYAQRRLLLDSDWYGTTQFICTGVDGMLYKYRDDLGYYQWLGD